MLLSKLLYIVPRTHIKALASARGSEKKKKKSCQCLYVQFHANVYQRPNFKSWVCTIKLCQIVRGGMNLSDVENRLSINRFTFSWQLLKLCLNHGIWIVNICYFWEGNVFCNFSHRRKRKLFLFSDMFLRCWSELSRLKHDPWEKYSIFFYGPHACELRYKISWIVL